MGALNLPSIRVSKGVDKNKRCDKTVIGNKRRREKKENRGG